MTKTTDYKGYVIATDVELYDDGNTHKVSTIVLHQDHHEDTHCESGGLANAINQLESNAKAWVDAKESAVNGQ